MNSKLKSALIPTIIGVTFLLIIIIGATFAFFTLPTTISGTKTNVNVEVGDVGTVSIRSIDSSITLDLSASEMLQQGSDVEYYASKNGTTTSETVENMGIVEVIGEGIFNCTYTMNIVASSTTEDTNMYTKFQNMSTKSNDQIVLTVITPVGNKTYDFNTSGLFTNSNSYKQSFTETIQNVKDGTPAYINAQLKLVNSNSIIQNDLNSSNITLTFSVSSFKCNVVG